MKPRDPDFSKPSRLAQHLSLLELEAKKLPQGTTELEAKFVEGMHPRPLQLPKHRGRVLWYFGSVAMAAAALMLALIGKAPEKTSPWLMKGAVAVQIYVEQGGEVKALSEAVPLTSADRIKAAITAPAPALAFWGVASRDDRLLSDPEWVWDNRLVLEALEKKLFTGSLQLDGPSEGETLCIVLCPAELVNSLETTVLIEELSVMIASKSLSTKGLKSCQNSCIRLRP